MVDAQKNLKKSLEKGIMKILSKMGISLLQCYHGAQASGIVCRLFLSMVHWLSEHGCCWRLVTDERGKLL